MAKRKSTKNKKKISEKELMKQAIDKKLQWAKDKTKEADKNISILKKRKQAIDDNISKIMRNKLKLEGMIVGYIEILKDNTDNA